MRLFALLCFLVMLIKIHTLYNHNIIVCDDVDDITTDFFLAVSYF